MPLYGPRWPLKIGNHDTYELYEDIKSQVSFYLRNLILTSPGENISDPNYGVGLRRYLFEQNIASNRNAISSEISEKISTYLPFITLSEVQVNASSDDIDSNFLNIRIIYSIDQSGVNETFELSTNETNQIGFY